VNPAIFHESRFERQTHEARRGGEARPAHEQRALLAAHERRLERLSSTGRQADQRLPRAGRAQPASHAAQPAANRHALAGHTRSQIHARHLARVRYQQELKRYRLELRQWRHLLTERARLLRKLASLEKRLARPTHERRVEVFEIDGDWYEQLGGGRPVAVKAEPA
jgi:hypothetical protein